MNLYPMALKLDGRRVLVVGLGCEANQINAWLAHLSLREGETLKVFNIQDTGGTRKTVSKGIALIEQMLPQANAVRREPCSASHITIGVISVPESSVMCWIVLENSICIRRGRSKPCSAFMT